MKMQHMDKQTAAHWDQSAIGAAPGTAIALDLIYSQQKTHTSRYYCISSEAKEATLYVQWQHSN